MENVEDSIDPGTRPQRDSSISRSLGSTGDGDRMKLLKR